MKKLTKKQQILEEITKNVKYLKLCPNDQNALYDTFGLIKALGIVTNQHCNLSIVDGVYTVVGNNYSYLVDSNVNA